jgi:hypothetical protein
MLKYILDDRIFVSHTCPYLWFISSLLIVFFELIVDIKASYGRYNTSNKGIPAKLAWFIQEFPSFAIPCYLLYYYWQSVTITKLIIVGLFLIHYFQRYVQYDTIIKIKYV